MLKVYLTSLYIVSAIAFLLGAFFGGDTTISGAVIFGLISAFTYAVIISIIFGLIYTIYHIWKPKIAADNVIKSPKTNGARHQKRE